MAKGKAQFIIKYVKELDTDDYGDDVTTVDEAADFDWEALTDGDIGVEEHIDEDEITVTYMILDD
jgi:hypothetical protein